MSDDEISLLECLFSLRQAQKRILELEAELLAYREAEHSVDRIPKAPEQEIVDRQLLLIRGRAMMGELELEDVKKLEVLVKTLYLSKSQNADLAGQYTRLPAGMTEAQLVAIASQGDDS